MHQLTSTAPAAGGADFSAPSTGVTAGRLEFLRGASQVTIEGRQGMDELFRAHFEGPVPEVRVDGGSVTIQHRPLTPAEWAHALLVSHYRGHVALNAGMPWEIEVRGGLSRLVARLEAVRVTAVRITGGASHVELSLGRPEGIVPVEVTGGVSHVTIARPGDVPVCASVRGGVSRLVLDEQRFGAIGGETRVTTGGWSGAVSGYDVRIGGGASHLTIESAPRPAPAAG
jgi:hypothetical protein